METIAFFGLGAMGKPMVQNLLEAGYTVRTALHPTQNMDFVRALEQYERFIICSGNEQAVQGADIIVTMVPGDRQVEEILLESGLEDRIASGAVIVDMSSCLPETVCKVETFYRSRGVGVVDAPVSGGVKGAEEGALTIFSAGEAQTIDRVWDMLNALGKTVFRLSKCGQGKTLKNLNNLLLDVNVLAVSEVFRIAKAHALDLDEVYQVVCAGSGASVAMEKRWGRMKDAAFDDGFRISLARKDLKNALTLAEAVPVPLAQLTYELMKANRAHDDLDLAAMCRLFETTDGK
ncbi:NAD(P)-dependent oxidoreductase [Agathobaculum sp. NTUH-O15-33]|uniref:NAD(P)-dependent oxidoreductase n=1 Tax=Agathobaculum sp. NTUH-O15-33 TaxID=3079302 RepID=UPI00295878CF|nr:NAD(P)-dependent oxidoreductase [Agathobaculum sp. NTUH-O15-33]WNX85711.1 NAD(P)-dependent oxidoreductase [Agathobaculum sp. NTUH-O15-33]